MSEFNFDDILSSIVPTTAVNDNLIEPSKIAGILLSKVLTEASLADDPVEFIENTGSAIHTLLSVAKGG